MVCICAQPPPLIKVVNEDGQLLLLPSFFDCLRDDSFITTDCPVTSQLAIYEPPSRPEDDSSSEISILFLDGRSVTVKQLVVMMSKAVSMLLS